MMGLIGGLALSAGLIEEESILDDENDIGSVSVLDTISSAVPTVSSFPMLYLLYDHNDDEATDIGISACDSAHNDWHIKRYYENGEIYEGPFLNGMRHGDGAVSTRDDRSKFCGSYKHDEPYHGTLITPEYTYFGHLQGNKFHGVGQLVYSNGTIYYGDFKYGLYHGVGKESTITCSAVAANENKREALTITKTHTYTGSFLFGRRHGIGTLMDTNTKNCIYSGEWNDGIMVNKVVNIEYDRNTREEKDGKKEAYYDEEKVDTKEIFNVINSETNHNEYETEEKKDDANDSSTQMITKIMPEKIINEAVPAENQHVVEKEVHHKSSMSGMEEAEIMPERIRNDEYPVGRQDLNNRILISI